MVLVIDNYDSFTWNLVQYLMELDRRVEVVRNDADTLPGLVARAPAALVVSPGPCTPREAGVSVAAIRHFAGRLPVLGVCLGHQCLAEAFGGRTVRAAHVVHGKATPIHHDGSGVFAGLPDPLVAGRYHSLVVDRASLPDCLTVTAWTDAGEIMALRHRSWPAVEGVQFHPESILTPEGKAIVRRFVDASRPPG
jgi:anthranilate synthase/aminodeoxychorismate synthase-like glutamine amidotransferase